MKNLLLFALLSLACSLQAQTNVRAWYADGQVWVVWEVSVPLPETYAVYAKPTAFANTANATLVGRLFKEEYGPAALREQVDSAATYHIPDGNGGIYVLADNEALFVATPHQAGALYFAVVAWGQTTVTPGVNITSAAVPFQYNPVGDPVECHLQKGFISPFDQNYVCLAYYMWADGRQNQWENRPDFPVMANAAKNGMPSLFIVSAPMGLDTTGGIPLSVWLHGGGGTARQSIAGSRTDIHLNPQKGILLAHNDDFFCHLLTFYSGMEGVTKHFGWRKNFDPFSGDPATSIDTIVNYTQRRYLWIDEWLIRNFNVDPNRVNINGHSMGSKGATRLAKAFPGHYASATILNNQFIEDDLPELIDAAFGTPADNFPTNLKTKSGEAALFSYTPDLTTTLSDARDWPLIRSFHSKNDDHWDFDIIREYHSADSLGWGAQLYWSERAHGPDTGPDYNDHWIDGNLPTQQTVVDDIAYEEVNFRSDVSFPAFFNHRLDPQNNDPGTGVPGINTGDGDNWGTWGGYHRWKVLNDSESEWTVAAWLESNAVFGNDNCPQDSLTADMMIRRPQKFFNVPGLPFLYYVNDANNGNYLQTGAGIANADGLVTLPGIVVYRENIRKVIIHVLGGTPVNDLAEVENATLFPNPSTGMAEISFVQKGSEALSIRIAGMNGLVSTQNIASQIGVNHIPLDMTGLEPGIYFISLASPSGVHTWKFLLLD